MKIDNLKDLKRLIQLCQEQGVKSITVDGIAIELSERPQQTRRLKQVQELTAENFPANSMDENIKIPQMDIPTDELSDEALLFYSAGGSSETAEQ